MKLKITLILLLYILPILAQSSKQNTATPKATSEDFLEIDNLIVDETISKMGNEFYNLFYSYWQNPKSSLSYTIFISEKPSPGRGNLVTIKINELLVFRRFITPRYDQIVENAGYAVKAAENYLVSYEAIQKQLNGDDLIGSGIF